MTKQEGFRKDLSRFGVISVFLSILGLGIFIYFFNDTNLLWTYLSILPGCIGIVLAIIGIVSISRKKDILRGRLYCFAAILIYLPCITFIGVSELCIQTRKYVEQTYTGIPRLRILSHALISYADKHNGFLPDANSWCDELLRNDPNLTRETFRNPDMGTVECGFAFNENLSRSLIANIHKRTVLLFEVGGQWNLSGSQELINSQKDNRKCIKIVFVDSNMADYWFYTPGVRSQSSFEHNSLQWMP